MPHIKIVYLAFALSIYSLVKQTELNTNCLVVACFSNDYVCSFGAPRIFKTVVTPLGPIRGRQLNTTTGNPVYTFKGIPYAEPPVGSLRFQPPVPVSSWTEEKDALITPNRCIQMDGWGNIKGDEDCLYLNVFSPELPSDTSVPRPVLVLIHVGCFRTGYAQQRSLDYYIDHGIVVVTIQYRLGALGFMSTGDSLLPGNLGMKDQVLALKWIKQNIKAFGGNPDEVTIAGQSSGGSAVHYHLLSPLSKDPKKTNVFKLFTQKSHTNSGRQKVLRLQCLLEKLRCPMICLSMPEHHSTLLLLTVEIVELYDFYFV
ncbi:esterase SG1-like [Schistocerca serialis cubense]|uniref:esterase SG1-like n=1 Tax=Schistocerca serialis cubense TaxID=2023355 RepID=UPI00214F18E6|nr:esterase SG1-like [Schistocerca serialis cubense]